MTFFLLSFWSLALIVVKVCGIAIPWWCVALLSPLAWAGAFALFWLVAVPVGVAVLMFGLLVVIWALEALVYLRNCLRSEKTAQKRRR